MLRRTNVTDVATATIQYADFARQSQSRVWKPARTFCAQRYTSRRCPNVTTTITKTSSWMV
jgi:hypothetical protein